MSRLEIVWWWLFCAVFMLVRGAWAPPYEKDGQLHLLGAAALAIAAFWLSRCS